VGSVALLFLYASHHQLSTTRLSSLRLEYLSTSPLQCRVGSDVLLPVLLLIFLLLLLFLLLPFPLLPSYASSPCCRFYRRLPPLPPCAVYLLMHCLYVRFGIIHPSHHTQHKSGDGVTGGERDLNSLQENHLELAEYSNDSGGDIGPVRDSIRKGTTRNLG
jgi:hypothetical protein